jgi:hypothetical protein
MFVKKWMLHGVYVVSIAFPCVVTCWTLCFGAPASMSDKVVLVALSVICVMCNAVLRYYSNAANAAHENLAREQSERIRFLQCHTQPTTQMVRDIALRIVGESSKRGFANSCDISTRDFAAVASFAADGSIMQVEQFMRVDDFAIAEFYGSGNRSIDDLLRRFMFEEVPFPAGEDGSVLPFRRMGRFILGATVPLYGTADRYFIDGETARMWIMGKDGVSPVLVLTEEKLRMIVGKNRWDAYATIISWCAESGLVSLREIAAGTPEGKWK